MHANKILGQLMKWHWHYTVCTCPPLWSSRQPPRQSTWMITWSSSSSSPSSWYHDRPSGRSHDRRHHPRHDHHYDILIITRPHLPLLSHDLPQLLRAQCSGAILVENLQQSCLSSHLANNLFWNLKRLFQTLFSFLCSAKLGTDRICQLSQFDV